MHGTRERERERDSFHNRNSTKTHLCSCSCDVLIRNTIIMQIAVHNDRECMLQTLAPIDSYMNFLSPGHVLECVCAYSAVDFIYLFVVFSFFARFPTTVLHFSQKYRAIECACLRRNHIEGYVVATFLYIYIYIK